MKRKPKEGRVVMADAGPGGLTAGMILGRRGIDVTIVEKQNRVGSRNAQLKVGEFTFDSGPTFRHQKFTLNGVFQEAGRKSEDCLDFLPLDPMTRLSWDGVSLVTTRDIEPSIWPTATRIHREARVDATPGAATPGGDHRHPQQAAAFS